MTSTNPVHVPVPAPRPDFRPSILRLGNAALACDVEFAAAVDAAAMRKGLDLGLLTARACALACCMAMASQLTAAQRTTAASARAVRHLAHVMGLPVGGGR